MRHALFAALSFVIVGCGGDDVAGFPDVDLGASTVEVYKSTPERDLHLHIFSPSGEESHASVIFFHGGGFRTTRIEQFREQAERLREAGIAGVVAEYRVSAEGTTRTDAVTDGADAVTFIQSASGQLGLDPTRVAIAGASAGGALAVEAGNAAALTVLFNPAVGPEDAPFVTDQSTLVFHSRQDTLVAFESVDGFCSAVADCEMVAFDEGDHGFFNEEPALTTTTDLMIDFLQGNGW